MSLIPPSRRAIAALIAATGLAVTELALAPGDAGAQQSGGSRVRVRANGDTTRRDSLIEVRVLGPYGGEMERLLREFAIRRRIEYDISQQLRALSTVEAAQGQATFEARRKELEESLRLVSRQGQQLRSRLVSLCPPEARPQGYMGVSFSGAVQMRRDGDGPVVYRYLEAPVVESVDPGSPAEAAGLRRGDRIVLFAGKDAADRDIVFADHLKPGTTLPMRIEREGRTRDVSLRIAKRPELVQQQPCPWMDARISAAFVEAPGFVYRFRTEGGQQGNVVSAWPTDRPTRIAIAPEAPPAPDAPTPGTTVGMPAPPAPLAPTPGAVHTFTLSARAIVGGAELIRLNDGLRSAVGVDRGVFVVDVARGTPAAQSGLRGGDVIVSVSGTPVSQPVMVQRIVAAAEDREVPLEIVREKRAMALTLRW
jgi:S1-C subfamily serine protease